MSTDDRIDDSESETDTKNNIKITQPLRQLKKSKQALRFDGVRNEEVDKTTVAGCSKNKITAEYVVPPIEHFLCEYCRENFEDQPSLGLHWQKCEEWKRTLKGYETLKKSGREPKSKTEMKEKSDIEEIRKLCKFIEDQVFEADDCKSKRCFLKTKHLNLLEAALILAKESKRVLAEKNKVLHHKNLVIRQYQLQKKKDDQEMILHRIRMIECLEKTAKLERILSDYDIRFVKKEQAK